MQGREHEMRRRQGESGSATSWALVWLVLVVWLAQIGMLVAGLVARQHHIDSAADLAALAAAATLQRGGEPCAAAARVAQAHDTELARCDVAGEDVSVQVSARVGLPLGLSADLVGVARAGP